MVKTEEITVLQPEASAGKPIPAASSKKRKYKGVRMRSWGSWVSEIRAPNQKTRIWLGSYSTAEAAARAYDAALICLKGSSANLNFPISTPPYIPDAVMSPKSIQRVAAAAAAAAASTDSIASSPPPATPPPPPPPTESSPPPSPSPSTSSSNLINDPDPYWPSCTSYANDPWLHPSPEDPWIDFDTIQSPKYATPDQMFNACSMYAPPTIEDYYYEEGDIPLWSFC